MGRQLLKMVEHYRKDAAGIMELCNRATANDWSESQFIAALKEHAKVMESDLVSNIGTPLEKHAYKQGTLTMSVEERAFRRGFMHGYDTAIDHIQDGCSYEEMVTHQNTAITDWRNGGDETEFDPPRNIKRGEHA